MASPWVGLERRCPQWMYRWSDINSGPQKCSTLSGYTGKVGWLWHSDLILACVDVLLLLIVAEVFQNHRRCRKDLGVSRLFSVSLKMIRVFFGRSSTLTVSTRVLCDCVFETVVRVPCSSFWKHVLLQASSGVKSIHNENDSHCNFCTQTVGPLFKMEFQPNKQSLFPLRFGKGLSVRSFHRNMELLMFGEPVCARATGRSRLVVSIVFCREPLNVSHGAND